MMTMMRACELTQHSGRSFESQSTLSTFSSSKSCSCSCCSISKKCNMLELLIFCKKKSYGLWVWNGSILSQLFVWVNIWFFVNIDKSSQKFLQIWICCQNLVFWLCKSYIQKAGDPGDISPPIFWIFRHFFCWERGTL